MATGQPIDGTFIFCRMAETERTPFGERLFKARSRAKLSQPQLSKAVGMAQSTLGELEWKGHGSQKTTQIALVCGVRPEWLASGEGPMVDNIGQLSPELQEIAEAFSGFTEEQIAYVMELTRMAINQAPRVGAPTGQRRNVETDESSSSVRRKV